LWRRAIAFSPFATKSTSTSSSATKAGEMNEVAIAKLLTAQTPDEFETHWQRLWQNFDLLYSIPETIPKLRQTILQLAVQGKLAEQDPDDEPASELIDKIQAKKKELMKAGEIRKSKPLGNIPNQLIPYDVPSNWQWVGLDDITDIGTGSTPLKATIEFYEDGTIPWITSAATSGNLITEAETYITDLAVDAHRLRLYPPGSLIVALYGQGKTRGQVARLGISATRP
jgi:type I restriction enzyme S subunit